MQSFDPSIRFRASYAQDLRVFNFHKTQEKTLRGGTMGLGGWIIVGLFVVFVAFLWFMLWRKKPKWMKEKRGTRAG
jgi:hypothetical protein